jgi:hypothetical protein
MKKITILTITLIFCFFVFNPIISAQNKKRSKHHEDLFYTGKPSIELSYGASYLSLKDFTAVPDKTGLIDLKLGYYYAGESRYSKSIMRFRNTFLYGDVFSTSLKLSNAYKSENDIWKFGSGTSEGYGYKIKNKNAIFFYNSNSISWTSYNYYYPAKEPEQEYSESQKYLKNISGSLRFGTNTEAGITVPLFNQVNLNAQFERGLVFPRHLFGKWLGSAIIEFASQALLDRFINEILKSSPSAGPIVNFLLKNGLSYGIYELRRSQMNWPFESEQPLLFDSFKAGFTIVF